MATPVTALAATDPQCCCVCTCPASAAAVMSADGAAAPTSSTATRNASVTINEAFPNPVGEDAAGEFIELRNASDVTATLDGWSISDASEKTFSLSGYAIAADGYLALPYSITKIGLNNDGETIALRDATNALRDSRSFDASSREGDAYAAFGDTWSWTDVPTPGATNIPATVPASVDMPFFGITEQNMTISAPTQTIGAAIPALRVIALLPNPAGTDDAEWIDVKNVGTDDGSLDGISVDDADGGSPPYAIPFGTMLRAGETMRFERSTTRLALNNDADHVRLLGADGAVIDDVAYESAPEGAAFALVSGTWAWTRTDDAETTAAATSSETPALPEPPDAVTTYDDVQDAPIGSPVSLRGTVALPLGRIGSATAIIVDPESGIPIFVRFYGTPKPSISVGDNLEVRGLLRDGKGYRYLAVQRQNFTLHSAKERIEYLSVAMADLDGVPNGSAIRIAGTVVRPGKRSFRLSEGGSDVRVDAGQGSEMPAKDAEASVAGILRRSSNGNEVVATDIEIAAKPAREPQESEILPAIEPIAEMLPSTEPAAMTAKWRTGIAVSLISSAVLLGLFALYRQRKRTDDPEEEAVEPFEMV